MDKHGMRLQLLKHFIEGKKQTIKIYYKDFTSIVNFTIDSIQREDNSGFKFNIVGTTEEDGKINLFMDCKTGEYQIISFE